MKTADPATDVRWLVQTIERVRRECRSSRSQAECFGTDRLLFEGRRLIEFGKELLGRARCLQEAPAQGRILFRDGLMIALLAVRPFRLKNFVGLRLRDNVILYRDHAWLRIPGEETKSGAPVEMPYPQELFPDLLCYLDKARIGFPNSATLGELWISNQGAPMSEVAASRMIRMKTLETIGYSISPHRFRHAAATFLAERHPELVNIAADLLGHSRAATTEAYYNHASSQSGASLLQANLIEEATRDTGSECHDTRATVAAPFLRLFLG